MDSIWCNGMEKEYTVRLAQTGDLPSVLALYAAARRFMTERGNPNQWGSKNPPEELIREDIRRGQLYLLTDGDTVHGVFAFILGEDPTYRVIHDGAWISESPYGTLHRVAGDGSGGIFGAAVRFCLKRRAHLRVDTHRDNLPMQRAILRAGFQKCGVIHIADGSPRIAYALTEKETAGIV